MSRCGWRPFQSDLLLLEDERKVLRRGWGGHQDVNDGDFGCGVDFTGQSGVANGEDKEKPRGVGWRENVGR